MSPVQLRNYVNGEWCMSTGDLLDVENPSTGETIARVPLSTVDEVNDAIQAAAAAFPAWRDTPVSRRVEYLFSLLERLNAHEERIARTLVEEMGKSLPDARAELKRMVENVQVACGMPIMQQGDKVVGSSFDIDGEVVRLPIGVFGMVAPFNFPAMVPFWFIPYALACGNTYVLKPSELVPCTMQLVAELMDDVGFPPGVFNLVHGDKTAASAILDSPDVAGVSFVGSSRVCREIATRCAQTNKRFQAMGSAKNHLVVMPDAKIDEAVRNMITSCFGCAGQRCMAASAVVCVGDELGQVVAEKLVAAAREVTVANPLDPEVADEAVVVGPVISAAARDRILGLIEEGVREGATLALDGRDVRVPGAEGGHYIGPTILTDVTPGMAVHTTEIFGPVVVVLTVQTLSEAIAVINDHQYGNGASIYTQSGYHARKFKLETQAGMIGINVGIPAPVAYLPFGGMKTSQFADIKAQGKAVVSFFTEDKVITERFWPEE